MLQKNQKVTGAKANENLQICRVPGAAAPMGALEPVNVTLSSQSYSANTTTRSDNKIARGWRSLKRSKKQARTRRNQLDLQDRQGPSAQSVRPGLRAFTVGLDFLDFSFFFWGGGPPHPQKYCKFTVNVQ